jgi:competence protein ComEA
LPETMEAVEKRRATVYPERRKAFEKFDLNQADTTILKSVYGIGSALASRIVKFRNGLGGFIRVEQLREVYGLDTAVVTQLMRCSYIAEDFQPQKINMNTSDEKMLASHPYVNRSLAKAIVSYRFQHGAFREVRELEKISLITPDAAGKLIPYLTTQD